MRSVITRLSVLFALCALIASAGQLNLSVPVKAIAAVPKAIAHPVQSFRRIPSDRGWMAATDAIFAAANYIDYQTTYQGPVERPGQFCENNPILVTSRCVINVPRFNGLKLGLGIFAAAEWIPPALHWDIPGYERWVIPINVALTVPLVIADVGNLRALASRGIQPVFVPIAPK